MAEAVSAREKARTWVSCALLAQSEVESREDVVLQLECQSGQHNFQQLCSQKAEQQQKAGGGKSTEGRRTQWKMAAAVEEFPIRISVSHSVCVAWGLRQ